MTFFDFLGIFLYMKEEWKNSEPISVDLISSLIGPFDNMA